MLYIDHNDITQAAEQQQLKDLTFLQFHGAELRVTNWFALFVSWIVFSSEHEAQYLQNGNSIPPEQFYRWQHEFNNSTQIVSMFVDKNQEGDIKYDRVLYCLSVRWSIHEYMQIVNISHTYPN